MTRCSACSHEIRPDAVSDRWVHANDDDALGCPCADDKEEHKP